jgi:hypothetical protein
MDEQTEYMLTTVDNPYNPFTDFDGWLAFDISKGYYTSSLLGRIAMVPDDLPAAYQTIAIQNAIDEIVRENVSGMWRKVSRESFSQ